MAVAASNFSKKRIREVYWQSCSHEGYLNIYVYRRLSIYLAVIAAKLSMTPNQLTLWSLIFSVIAAGMFAFENMAVVLLALIPFHIGKILDCADGQLASLTNQRSALGAFLDPFFDRIVDIAILLGLTIGYIARGGSGLAFYLVLALIFVQFINAYLDKYAAADEQALDSLRSTTSRFSPKVRRLMKWDGGFTGLITTLAVLADAAPVLVLVFLAISALTIPIEFKKIYNRLKLA